MTDLIKTEALIEQLFGNTFDDGGDSFANHMRRVAARVPEEHKIIALLHDVVEDTPLTLHDLAGLGYDEATLKAVDLLTHRKKEMSYQDYIDRICASGNRAAIWVKLADQEDNLDPRRWLYLNRYKQNALRKRYAGVKQKLMAAAIALEEKA